MSRFKDLAGLLRRLLVIARTRRFNLMPTTQEFSKRPLEAGSAVSDCKRAKPSPCGREQEREVQQTEKKRANVGFKEGRRDRRGTRGTRVEGNAEGRTEGGEKRARLPKRNCAVLLGFCGTGYYGMQMYVTVLFYTPSSIVTIICC